MLRIGYWFGILFRLPAFLGCVVWLEVSCFWVDCWFVSFGGLFGGLVAIRWWVVFIDF